MSDLSDRLAQLTSEQRKQLLQRVRAKIPADSAQTIPRRPAGGPIPLSFNQERLWFLHQVDPDLIAYNVPIALRFRGGLDLTILEEALRKLTERHEALRTVFRASSETPEQIVYPAMPMPLHLLDLSDLPDTRRCHALQAGMLAASRSVISLEHGPSIIAKLYRLTSDEHVLLLVMHHMIVDCWSVGILTRDLGELYSALYTGIPPSLPPLPIQSADHASWERSNERERRHAQCLAYWKKHLAGIPEHLEFPTDHPRPTRLSQEGGRVSHIVNNALLRQLKDLSQDHEATLATTLLTAFEVLMMHYSGAEDFALGTLFANRTHQELEPLVTFLVNTLVVRADLRGNPSFGELLARVRQTTSTAYDHLDLPFERLVQELSPTRDQSRHPIFQHAFSLQNMPHPTVRFADANVELMRIDNQTTKFDLVVQAQETPGGLVLTATYSSDLFNKETVATLLGHYETLLSNLPANLNTPVQELDILSTPEVEALQTAVHGPPLRPKHATLATGFSAAVQRFGTRRCVCDGDVTLTYAELDARAIALANQLRAHHFGRRDRVAILLDRGLDMITAIIAVTKIGATYVPLDPTHPEARLAFVLADSDAAAVVTCPALSSRVSGTTTILVAPDSTNTQPVDLEVDKAGPNDEAYIIYTSGSTGTPKGVRVTNRNLMRLFAASEDLFAFDETDVWTLFHSIAFDFSVWEMWGALLHGAALVVIPADLARTPDHFADFLDAWGVTILNQTPSAFQSLIPAIESRGSLPSQLRTVIFGGEALPKTMLNPWFERHGDHKPALVNMYGITETTVHVTFERIRSHREPAAMGSRIGRPLPDLYVRLLNPAGKLVPVGVPGEIHVGGAGVSPGYLNRDQLTADRFVPDLFGDPAKQRLYRSGDRARWLPDGTLEYLGRIDDQVKLRGYRIEPNEIAAVLCTIEGISNATVVARAKPDGEQALVAYLVSPALPAFDTIRQTLRQQLPDYMIPVAFVELPALPLTANGKLDRAALPPPDWAARQQTLDALPCSETERFLAKTWQRLLGVNHVGLVDNFFDLGGHSLTLIRLRYAIRQAYDLDLSLHIIFDHPTLESMAAAIDSSRRGK